MTRRTQSSLVSMFVYIYSHAVNNTVAVATTLEAKRSPIGLLSLKNVKCYTEKGCCTVALSQITWALNTPVRIFCTTRSSVWKCVNFPLLSWLSPCPAKEDERWTNEEYWRRLLWLPWWRRWCPCSPGTTGWEGRWGNLCELQKLTYFNWVM